VDVPDPTKLAGVTVQLRPVEGETLSARLTVPLKPLIGVTVMVEVPEAPTKRLTEVGLEDIVKSGPMKRTVTE